MILKTFSRFRLFDAFPFLILLLAILSGLNVHGQEQRLSSRFLTAKKGCLKALCRVWCRIKTDLSGLAHAIALQDMMVKSSRLQFSSP